jgi:crotonobetainyl-CoA:carnitine CoA-transferase CaiB-like acyl-CoA transferase
VRWSKSGDTVSPVPPVNLVGDFGAGGMLLAFGMCAALLSAIRTGKGQVIDAAVVDGSAALTTMLHSNRAMGVWRVDGGTNILDTGAHFSRRSTKLLLGDSWPLEQSSHHSMPSS